MQSNTLVDILRTRAQEHPERPLYSFLNRAQVAEQELTFAGLDARARGIAARLQGSTRVGDCAAVICPNDLSFIEAFMGCQYAGVIPVPTPPLQGFHAIERLRAVFDTVSSRLYRYNQHCRFAPARPSRQATDACADTASAHR